MQEEFLRLPSTIFEAFYGGAAGGGKSDVLLMLPIVKGWYKHPQFNGAIFRRTFPELEESLIHKSDTGIGINGPTYWDFGGEYDKTRHVWTFTWIDDEGHKREGGKVRFLYSQRESDVTQHDTAEFHYLGLDELTHFTWYQYSYLTSRCRSTIPEIKKVVRAASNPGNIGHTWVYKRFIEPAEKGRKILAASVWDKDTNEWRQIKRIFIPAKASDNPYLMKANPDYVLQLGLLPEAERKAKAEGDWHTFAGQMFSEFRSKHHELEPDNALHVIPEFDIPRWWPRMLCLDWGYQAMTYAAWYAISPWKRVYQYREYHCYGKDIKVWGADIQRESRKDGVPYVAYVVDPSADKNFGLEKTVWEQINEATGMPFELGDNDRLGGIAVIHDFLRWKSRPPRFMAQGVYTQETYDRLFRMYGTEAAEKYKRTTEDDPPESDLPLFQIFDTCPIKIAAFPMVVYRKNAESGKKAEDYADFDGDDPIDETRYALKRAERFMLESSKQWEKYQKMDKAISQFQRTGNYNDLDRSLTKAEERSVSSLSPLPRGSSRGYLYARTGGQSRPRRRGFYSVH